MKRFRIGLLLAYCIVYPWIVLLIGCNTKRGVTVRPPAATISTPSGASIAQTGDAQTAASVTVSSDARVIPLPAGTSLVFDEKAATLTVRLSTASAITSTARSEHAEAPRAFTPPAPPSPAQLAQADGVRWFYVAAILGIVAAGLLAWSGHGLAALKVGAGALSLPVLAHFYSSGVALAVSGVLVGVGVAFFAAWHVLKARGMLKS